MPEYKAGVFWVGLAALRDPALVTETIAQTLGAKDGLAEHIAERELLLLLDNLEQVIEAAPELSALRQACPNWRSSSRAASCCACRARSSTRSRRSPSRGRRALLRALQLEPSREIAELCPRLDSLPLAVELAAARTKALTPAQILERLSQRLDLLKGGRDADPASRRSARRSSGATTCSHAEEQRLFARLVRVRRRLHARGRRRGRRRRPRHPAVARREEPPPLHQRALLDARDDPGVCR